jgi:hypothetical protein
VSQQTESGSSSGSSQEQSTVRGSYIYGIVPAGVRIPDGLEPIPTEDGTQLGLVTEGGLAAVVSDVDAGRALGTRKDLMAHEAVLNAIAQDTPVLPMRFGAVVTDDDAVAEELLAPHQDYFVRALEQLEGHLEFRLRGDYDQDVILTRILEEDPRIQQMREKVAGVDEDASYYDRIRLGEAISTSRSSCAPTTAATSSVRSTTSATRGRDGSSSGSSVPPPRSTSSPSSTHRKRPRSDVGFFTELLLLPLAPVRGVAWVGEKIADQVDHQMNDPAVIRAQIDELDAAHERGEITEEERDEQQEVLLQRLVGGGGG